jgi:hypothetical protein
MARKRTAGRIGALGQAEIAITAAALVPLPIPFIGISFC